jgi:hypothetical protein
MELDLRVLRWCVIPAALLVCVTLVLWQFSAQKRPPTRPARDTGQTSRTTPRADERLRARPPGSKLLGA